MSVGTNDHGHIYTGFIQNLKAWGLTSFLKRHRSIFKYLGKVIGLGKKAQYYVKIKKN